MHLRPRTWFLISLLLFAAAAWFWHLGNKRMAQEASRPPSSSVAQPDLSLKSVASARPPQRRSPSVVAPQPQGTAPSSVSPTTQPASDPRAAAAAAEAEALAKSLYPHRLNNTRKGLDELARSDTALLLRNAFIDTSDPAPLPVPEHLRAADDPGSYLVQARGPITEEFRSALRAQAATIVSYIPNNALLVRVSADGARALAAAPQTQAVLPYEPYYKLASKLLALAVDQQSLPVDSLLNVTLFPGDRDTAVAALTDLGAEVLTEQPTPFGPQLTLRPPADSLVALANLSGVQGIEPFYERVLLNDLTRLRLNVPVPPVPSVTGTNHLGLSGTNVLVNVNDTGVDAQHPALIGRVFAAAPSTLLDPEGHGTHVAGIIASNGTNSPAGTNAPGSTADANFRGIAPAAKIFALPVDLVTGPLVSDAYLQETAAKTNAFISNNSWGYGGASEYNSSSASFDAAARDALPRESGSQPVLFVFAAGNDGYGGASGLGGEPGRILSPATAKNVITVGAIDNPRFITNEVTFDQFGQTVTNAIFLSETDSDTEVTPSSSRGNVGLGLEGQFGRFKPDVVAPGAFVVSTRSKDWDIDVNATERQVNTIRDQVADPDFLSTYFLTVPDNAVRFQITLRPNLRSPSPFPGLPIYAKVELFPTTADFIATNRVSVPPDAPFTPGDWRYSIGNDGSQPVDFDIVTVIETTNRANSISSVLKQLSDPLAPHYRFASGTSMSAPAISGVLALMQEFFRDQLKREASPALMKALLINGARTVSQIYDLNPRSLINYQGWGLANLQNSIPTGMTNTDERTWPARFFDQEPTNAVATGQSRSWKLDLSSVPEATASPLRVTLVWTDPPGNPNVALKLVNDLDLVVYSLGADTDGNPVTNAVYFGNNFAGGTDFTQASGTNDPPAFDIVNNVENIFLKEPLETNYVISVIGRRVNVNAVSTNDTDVVQDFALVISSGLTNALKELTPFVKPLELRATTLVTNGVALLNQRVGANPAMLPQSPGLPNSVGLPGQWTFYVFTNEFNPEANSFMTNGTNVAFVTFLPPDLARPRTLEADIDLYVSRDPALTNLVPAVVAAADKSTNRGGTELVVYTNAPVGSDAVFYIGVKSEDQQGAEYAFVGLSSNVPFEEDINGTKVLRAPQILVNIPDGSPNQPGGVNVLAIGITPLPVLRTVVTNTITHDDVGDLLGNLSHNNRFSVLNNHRLLGETNSGTFTFVYDDTDQKELGWQPTDGPGSLTDFVGELSSGVWLLTMVDNSLSHTGRVDYLTIRIDPDLTGDLLRRGRFRGTVGPGRFAYFIANVPPDASQLDVFLSDLQPSLPLELYLRYAQLPDRTTSDKFAFINPPGGKLSLSVNDVPPLNAGLYFIGVYNPNNQDVSFDIEAQVLRGYAGARFEEFFSPDTPLPILDDAITNSTIRVDVDRPIGDIRVGLRLDHPRASDLVLHLVSPQGTRFLLAENRGLDTATRYGGGGSLPEVASYTGFTEDTNIALLPIKYAPVPFTLDPAPVPLLASDFETVPPGLYTNGQTIEGWLIETNQVTVGSGRARANSGTNYLAMASARISQVVPTTAGKEYKLRFAFRSGAQGLFNTGVDDSGRVMPAGAQDLHYQLIQSAAGGSTAFVVSGTLPTPWLTNDNFSKWISPRADARAGVAAGTYVYRTGFDLSAVDPLSAQVQGRVAVDHRVLDILLNGLSTGISYFGSTLFSPDFVIGSGFKPGLNTLDFVVDNRASASGLRAEARLTAKPLPLLLRPLPAQVLIGGVLTNDILGRSLWQTNVFDFIAPSNDVPLAFTAGATELRLDSIQMREVADTWFLPEESLRSLIGESALGDWRLELWDNRVGPLALNPGALLSWRLQLRLANTNFAAITLTNGVCYSGTVASNEVKFFIVNAPPTASIANNLVSGSGDLVLLFNQNGLPTGQLPGDVPVDTFGPGGAEQLVLTTNTPPIFQPGQRYYLGVTTPGQQSASDFTICVNFGLPANIITLTNAVPYLETIAVTNELDYYQFLVSPTAYVVTFDLVPVNGDVNLFVSKSQAVANQLPTPTVFDYSSAKPGIVDEQIVVTPGSPVALAPGLWYLGVQNADIVPVDYAIMATELTNAPNIIRLTPDVPLNFTMPAGRPITNYFVFSVTQTNPLVQFDVFNLNGKGDLLLQFANLPAEGASMVKDPGAPTAPARIRLRADPFLPTLNGDWFLTVANQETNDLAFTILATLPVPPLPILTLTNGLAYTNTVPDTFPAALVMETDLYQFEVSTNALAADFEVFPVDGNVDLVITKAPKRPTDRVGDYLAGNAGTASELIHVDNFSWPLALTPGTWYLAVVNRERHSVTYSVRVTEYLPVIVPLTSSVSYSAVLAPTGRLDYYSFNVSSNAIRAVFEILGGFSPVQMFIRNALPLPDENNAVYRTTFASRRITVLTNSLPVPLTPGLWYLSVTNQAPFPANYSIRATEFLAAPPNIVIDPALIFDDQTLCLTWTSQIGTKYFIQAKINLTDAAWTTITTTIIATDTKTTHCLDLPTPYRFFRVGLGEGLGPPPPTVTVAATDAAAAETGPGVGVFTVTRSGSTAAPLAVNFTLSGTASDGGDYEALATSVTIPAGAASVDLLVTPKSDDQTEGDETVVLTLAADAAYLVGDPSTATVTIADAAPPSPVVIDPSTITVTADSICFTFASQIGLSYFVQGKTSLTDAAWAEVPDTRVTATAATTQVCVKLPSAYRFFRVVGGGAPPVLPTVTVNATDAVAAEVGPEPGAVTVTRTGPTAAPLVVHFTLGGTASDAVDYETLGSTVTIPAGAANADVIVTPKPDSLVEGDETVTLALSADAAYLIGASNEATVTIQDAPPPVPIVIDPSSISLTPDSLCLSLVSQIGVSYFAQGKTNITDASWIEMAGTRITATNTNATVCIKLPTPFQFFRIVGEVGLPVLPTVTVTATDATAMEGGVDLGTFTVARTGATAAALVVKFTLTGTASGGVDYEPLAPSLTIPAGAASADLPVSATSDAAVEGDETVTLTLSADPAYLLGAPDGATVTIQDAPPPVPVVINPGSITVRDNSLCLTFDSQVGVKYYLQGKATLTDAVWTSLPATTATATTTTTTFCADLSTGHRFFRVVGEGGAPPPPAQFLIDAQLQFKPDEVCLSWNSVAGANYFVQGKANLGDPKWTTLSPVIASGGAKTLHCLPFPSPFRFFRVGQGTAPAAGAAAITGAAGGASPVAEMTAARPLAVSEAISVEDVLATESFRAADSAGAARTE